MYRIEKGKAFYVVLKVFCFFGCLPSDNESRNIFLLKSAISKLIPLVIWFMLVHHCIMSAINHRLVSVRVDLAHISTFGGITLMPILFTYHRQKWIKLFKDVTDVDAFGKPLNFEAKGIYGNLLATIYLCYSVIGLFFGGATALLTVPHCRKFNEENDLHEVCAALAPVWLPSVSGRLSLELTVFILQLISINLTFAQAIAVAILPLTVAELIISHIGHFKMLFNDIFEEEDRNEMFVKLGLCIKYNNYILRMASDLSHLSKITLGHMSLISAIAIGCFGNLILEEENLLLDLRAFVYVVGFTVSLFILCHSGQKLTNETSSIHEALYCSNWYLSNTKMIKDVQLMILRSGKPVCIEALPLGYFDYPLFLMVIKTAYSYVTLLRETT